jgi:hypothetical protein
MKEEVSIINVMMIDENNVELTCNSLVAGKRPMDAFNILNGDLMDIQRSMVAAQPKMFKVVVSRQFYDQKNLNIYKTVKIEIS